MSDNFRELLVIIATLVYILISTTQCYFNMAVLLLTMQVKFGEPLSTDSEDFFGDVAKFVSQFKRVRVELFPPKKPAMLVVVVKVLETTTTNFSE